MEKRHFSGCFYSLEVLHDPRGEDRAELPRWMAVSLEKHPTFDALPWFTHGLLMVYHLFPIFFL